MPAVSNCWTAQFLLISKLAVRVEIAVPHTVVNSNCYSNKNGEERGISYQKKLSFCSFTFHLYCISQLAEGVQPKPLVKLAVAVPHSCNNKDREDEAVSHTTFLLLFLTFYLYCILPLAARVQPAVALTQTAVTIKMERVKRLAT